MNSAISGVGAHLEQQPLDPAEERRVLKDRAAGGGNRKIGPGFQLRAQRGIVEPVGLRPGEARQLVDGGAVAQRRIAHGVARAKAVLDDLLVVVEEQEEVAVPVFGDAQFRRPDIAGADAALVVDAAHIVHVDVQGVEQVAVAVDPEMRLEPFDDKLAGRHHRRHAVGFAVIQRRAHTFFGVHRGKLLSN